MSLYETQSSKAGVTRIEGRATHHIGLASGASLSVRDSFNNQSHLSKLYPALTQLAGWR